MKDSMKEIIGEKINHRRFGEGTIIDVDRRIVVVRFKSGLKRLALPVVLNDNILTGSYSVILTLKNIAKGALTDTTSDTINKSIIYEPFENDTPIDIDDVENTVPRKILNQPKSPVLPPKKDWLPVKIEKNTRGITSTWWGKHWNQNLNSYADFRSRIGRGRDYLRKGAIKHLDISEGLVTALVSGSGSHMYMITIRIDTLSPRKKERILALCRNKIGSIEELLSGEFPAEFRDLFTNPEYELFPDINQIHFECSCPDWAKMCKHVAAVLYGIGTRLDEDPMLFFKLRNVDISGFIEKSLAERLDRILTNAEQTTSRTLSEDEVRGLF